MLVERVITARRLSLNLLLMSGLLLMQARSAKAEAIQFNTDVLDIKDRANIDLGQFSRKGYIMPGTYLMMLTVNGHELSEQNVEFVVPEGDEGGSEACLTPEMTALWGLKPAALESLTWDSQRRCLNYASLNGISVTGNLATATLAITVPQAYLEYVSDSWDPPSRWDNGIPGLLADYNVNMQTTHPVSGASSYSVSGNGIVGANAGPWRLRADWQSRIDHTGDEAPTRYHWEWSRYYAYRAVPRLGAKLTFGDDYLYSDLFDSFSFLGISLRSDDNMLPSNLRGYAPEVAGVARTNARVVISQEGRVLYETQVAQGPFRIQDLNSSTTGTLDVRVEEQDGTVQTFTVTTANVPYLTRPGMMRYRFSAGQAEENKRRAAGPTFGSGEFSWGINNGWSLYGGGLFSRDYQAASLGLGRDLLVFGALSFDMTQSRAQLPDTSGVLSGASYRLSYSKRFDEYNSQVSFAGYRFSEKGYMSATEYLSAYRTGGVRQNNSKALYTVTLNKQFVDAGLSTFLTWGHQTYWNRPTSDRYNLATSKSFNMGNWQNLHLSLNAYREKRKGVKDDGLSLYLSVPWGNGASINYSASQTGGVLAHSASYYDRLRNGDYYQLNAGTSQGYRNLGAYYSHTGGLAQINANLSYLDRQYTAAGLSLQGGFTATAKGVALHRASAPGGTRLMVDVGGASGVPVRGYGQPTRTNLFGKAVVTDVSSYYRSSTRIDLDRLNDNVEVTRSVVQTTLTEGAIGYRQFDAITGSKAMAIVRLADGSYPPFGARVLNRQKQEVGLISDEGNVYLIGIHPDEQMSVEWDGVEQCAISLPEAVTSGLLLPCRK